jgi:rRNA-processing protein FCF1
MPSNLSTLKEIELYHLKRNEVHLILDTNVLLLFLVGIYDVNYLKDCPLMTDGNKVYNKEHFELVEKIIKQFPNKIVVTPHIISEMNMLSRTRIKPEDRLRDYFTKLIKQLENYKEHLIALKVLLNSGGIIEFGVTDISLIEAAKQNKWLILTNDSNLYYRFAEYGFIIYFDTIVANEIGLKN